MYFKVLDNKNAMNHSIIFKMSQNSFQIYFNKIVI